MARVFRGLRRGDLIHKIVIKTVTDTSDGRGAGGTETETTFATVWASIWQLSGAEFIQNDKNTLDVTHRLKFDYLSGFTFSKVIYFGTRKFEVKRPFNPDERNVYHDILAKETT